MEINIKIPKKGTYPGSCGWVRMYLANCEVYLTYSKKGHPGIFIKEPGAIGMPVCLFREPADGFVNITRSGQNYAKVQTVENDYTNGLFKCQLTKAATKFAHAFIDGCLDALVEIMEADEELPAPVITVSYPLEV